jgi:hypothetical protein
MAENESTLNNLSGAEHFLIGISPQYWSHTPLSIRGLNELGLVDGMDCIVIHDCQTAKQNNDEEEICETKALETRFIPVSKCELHGVIVNMDRRSNGSFLYLLDDGTGVVDCLYWADNAMYSLPSLVPDDGSQSEFRVGDLVRIFGKIKCVSIGSVRESIKVHEQECKVHYCVREVHITKISRVPLNSQSNHWLKCLQFARRTLIRGTNVDTRGETARCKGFDELNYHEQKRLVDDSVRNGPDVLRLLGPEIASKVRDCSEFPAPDDTCGAWRVFGAGCQCNLPYLDSLLYCHCQATVVPLDPHFKFRDAVLELLLKMESKENSQLRFHYKAIVNNESLQEAAAQAVANERNESMSTDRLFIQTFAALRDDGVLSLLDRETDTYLLVSRAYVLDPHCKKLLDRTDLSLLERRVLRNEQPAYLKHVTPARMQYVKKTLMDSR